jgi:hypothetical protein
MHPGTETDAAIVPASRSLLLFFIGGALMTAADSPQLSPRSKITMREDHVVLLRHRIAAEDDFERAANDVFTLAKTAQDRHPGAIRSLVLTIEGHVGERAGFDTDFFEFQQEFMLGAIGKFFTWIEMPLTGKLGNPAPQEDDLPDSLRLEGPA